MLNSTTKQKINSLRQILVGKVPDPKSQVEQITNALIYKYMDDMDRQAELLGGKASFFTGEYAKYSWRKLMDTKLGGQERMNLYVEALERMSENKKLSPIFRQILKGAFLPYRSPETLNLFLAEVNGFTYEHSEELGNAYEYLLSIMGSQGDAGQFRTPRHIIDFIVRVVNPDKNDKILDPACGTAGFLISAYKHIIGNHDGKDNETGKPTTKETRLTPGEMKEIHKSFSGYDIDPGMAKLARVNMFLHGFPEPRIDEYDTLSSEERWSEKFDVILANPPFMSPKGGIIPHSKFSIKAKRAEVLFVDYIMEHLKPKGRAGIIVPEGIIFKAEGAYKQLRKKLIEDGLFAVVSLPSGVFNPYAGVKTSVLLFDAQMGKEQKEILFVKIEKDGYDLGAQRRKLCEENGDRPEWCPKHSDLAEAEKVLSAWRAGTKKEGALAHWVPREKIAEDGEYNFSGSRYAVSERMAKVRGAWPMVELGEVLQYEQPTKYIVKSTAYDNSFETPVLTAGKSFLLGRTNEDEGIFPKKKLPVIIFDDFTTANKFVDFPFKVKSSAIKILHAREGVNIIYVFYAIQNIQFNASEHKRYWISQYSKIKIPLPPLEVQEQIVAEIDGYQKIIDGAKQIIQNWKPKIDIDPKWEKINLGDVCSIGSSKRVFQKDWRKSGIPFYRAREIVSLSRRGYVNNELFIDDDMFQRYSKKYGAPKHGDLMVTGVGTLGICYLVKRGDKFYFKDGNILWLRDFSKGIDSKFIKYLFETDFIKNQIKENAAGGTVGTYTIIGAKNTVIPFPPLKIQKQIVEKIESERALVESNKKLIEIYEKKIKEVIDNLWGE